jgi:multiple sugar transport system permease protein
MSKNLLPSENGSNYKIPAYYWFLLPAFLLIALFMVYPTLYQLYLSFFSTTLYSKGSFVGLRNFMNVFMDPVRLEVTKNTVIFVITSTVIEVVWGLILALALNTLTFGKRFLRGVIIVPLMLTPVAVGSMWNFMYFPEGGAVNTLFRCLGFPLQTWLANSTIALLALIAVEVWQYTSFSTLVLLAGLQSIPVDMYEAADIDGAGRFQVFRYITAPLLKGVLAITLIFNIMRQFKTFDIIYTISKGGPGRATSVISFDIYQTAYRFYNISEAAALSFIVLIVVLIISNTFIKAMQRND